MKLHHIVLTLCRSKAIQMKAESIINKALLKSVMLSYQEDVGTSIL